jgi:hypothetical protein
MIERYYPPLDQSQSASFGFLGFFGLFISAPTLTAGVATVGVGVEVRGVEAVGVGLGVVSVQTPPSALHAARVRTKASTTPVANFFMADLSLGLNLTLAYY